MRCLPYGDGAIFVDLEIDDAVDRREQTLRVASALRSRLPQSEVVVGAGSIAVLGIGAFDDLEGLLAEALRARPQPERIVAEHQIDVIYDGPDLDEVARSAGLSREGVVSLHTSREYVVELIGFLPGFGYLGPLDPRLVMGRRLAPRPRVSAGSVGIAGTYTGIYPSASPGGWHLLGHAVGATLFDPGRPLPALLQPGDRVRFVARHA
jgi:KipI family sensor histidine kinase inhibitor